MKRTRNRRNALLPALFLVSFSGVGVLSFAGPSAQNEPLERRGMQEGFWR